MLTVIIVSPDAGLVIIASSVATTHLLTTMSIGGLITCKQQRTKIHIGHVVTSSIWTKLLGHMIFNIWASDFLPVNAMLLTLFTQVFYSSITVPKRTMQGPERQGWINLV